MFHEEPSTYAEDTLNSALTIVSGSLSILGSTLIIVTCVCYKDIRTLTRNVIVCISIADIVTAIANISGLIIQGFLKGNSWYCQAQSLVGSTASSWSYLWTVVLAFVFYLLIVKENQRLVKKLNPWFHAVCWSVPVLINVILFCCDKLGTTNGFTTGGWCWIHVAGITFKNVKFLT